MEHNKVTGMKSKRLPAINLNKTKTTFQKDKLKIEDLFLENARNRLTHKDYRHEE